MATCDEINVFVDTAKIWNRNISSASEKSCPRYCVDLFGCQNPLKKSGIRTFHGGAFSRNSEECTVFEKLARGGGGTRKFLVQIKGQNQQEYQENGKDRKIGLMKSFRQSCYNQPGGWWGFHQTVEICEWEPR